MTTGGLLPPTGGAVYRLAGRSTSGRSARPAGGPGPNCRLGAALSRPQRIGI